MPGSFTGPVSFYEAGEDAWWASVDKALRGASRQKLYSESEDGLAIAPLYTRAGPEIGNFTGRAAGNWSIVQRIDLPDLRAANTQILEDLQGGASGLELLFSEKGSARGIQCDTIDELTVLLEDVQPNLIDIRLDGAECVPGALALFLTYLDRLNVDADTIALHAGYDPFALFASSGRVPSDADAFFAYVRDILGLVQPYAGSFRILQADGRVWHNAGATAAQELAAVLATGVAHLRVLEAAGVPPETWAKRISFALSADADQFGTISKARAFRALWSCVLEGADLAQSPAHLHMSTSSRMLTAKDPWVNLLRNTVAAFGAGVGGADSICVQPHTSAVGLPEAFARRMARNTQSILLEESSLAKVMDPAAGAGGIEDRTQKLCQASWDIFQELEAAGGMLQALEKGLLQTRIATANTARALRIATRKQAVTGVSEFPNLEESEIQVLDGVPKGVEKAVVTVSNLPEPGQGQWFAAVRDAAGRGQRISAAELISGAAVPRKPIERISPVQDAAPYERLRRLADAHEKNTGAPLSVFLASLGSLAEFTARATWTANAFATGGIRSVGPSVFKSMDDLVDAYKESGARLVCLVSSDPVYEREAEEVARAMKAANAQYVYLAGRPAERQDAYVQAGVDAFIYAGCNLLDLLGKAHTMLGVNEAQSVTGEETA